MKTCATCGKELHKKRPTCGGECSKIYLTKKANAKRYKPFVPATAEPGVRLRNLFLLAGDKH